MDHGRNFGVVNGDRGQITVKKNELGAGPVSFRALGLGERGAASHVMAAPVEVTIDPVR